MTCPFFFNSLYLALAKTIFLIRLCLSLEEGFCRNYAGVYSKLAVGTEYTFTQRMCVACELAINKQDPTKSLSVKGTTHLLLVSSCLFMAYPKAIHMDEYIK